MDDDTQVRVAKDEVIFAERAVALLEQERTERIREVEALDGTLTAAWTRLTGTREARIEAALRAVRDVDRRLGAARGRLTEAQAKASGAVGAREQGRRDAETRAEALRRRIDEVASEPGARGDRVRALRLERELLAERHALLDEAAHSGSQLLAGLNTVVRSSDRLEEQSRQRLAYRGPMDPRMRLEPLLVAAARVVDVESERHHVSEGVSAVAAHIERFRTAVAGLGAVFEGEVPKIEPSWLAWSSADVDGGADQAQVVGDRVRDLLIPIDRERRDLAARLAELDTALAGEVGAA